MLERNEKFLPREDRDASHLVHEQMIKDGVNIKLNTQVLRVEKLEETWGGEARVRVHFQTKGQEPEFYDVCALVLAIGRRANLKNLNLEAAGIKYDK